MWFPPGPPASEISMHVVTISSEPSAQYTAFPVLVICYICRLLLIYSRLSDIVIVPICLLSTAYCTFISQGGSYMQHTHQRFYVAHRGHGLDREQWRRQADNDMDDATRGDSSHQLRDKLRLHQLNTNVCIVHWIQSTGTYHVSVYNARSLLQYMDCVK